MNCSVISCPSQEQKYFSLKEKKKAKVVLFYLKSQQNSLYSQWPPPTRPTSKRAFQTLTAKTEISNAKLRIIIAWGGPGEIACYLSIF